MTFRVFRISEINLETSMEYLQRHFIKHPACIFLEKTDLLFWMLRYTANNTGQELLSEPPQNKMCYILHICLSPASQEFARLQSESICYSGIKFTDAYIDMLKKAD